MNLARYLNKIEASAIRRALQRCEYNQIRTARNLEIDYKTLWRKMQKYSIPGAYQRKHGKPAVETFEEQFKREGSLKP